MKKKILNIMIILSFSILFLSIILHKNLVFDTITYSLNLWVKNLIPSMFPCFVISDILISFGITNYIPNIIKKTFSKLFLVSDDAVTVFFLSCLSGFPSNARNVKTLYLNGKIDENEGTHILIFTHFSNPLFVLSTIAVLFLHNELYGYLILISHYLGNIILGIITRNKEYCHKSISNNIDNKNFSVILVNAIKSSIDTLLMILGTLTCFLIISSLIINFFNVNLYTSALIKGILEMTMGLKSLSILNISDIYKVVISTMFISFGSLSVHLQVISQIVDTKIQYKPYFIARIFHAIISGIISYFGYLIFFS